MSHTVSHLVGLIGAGIGASLTPAMHEHEADALGMRYTYRLIDLDRLKLGMDALPELLVAAERMGFSGLNITYPCKQNIIPLLDELSDDARALGAVNTVVLRNGKRIGHNTDWSGFARGFRRALPDADMTNVVLLGAGGAGSAVAHAALMLGAKQLTIFDIDVPRVQTLADSLRSRFGSDRIRTGGDLAQALRGATGLIHATPTGMKKLPGMPLPAGYLHAGLWVAEIVYFPLETELLRTARAAGCPTVHGGGMAVFQAVDAFRLFTGATPDAERMMRHFSSLVTS